MKLTILRQCYFLLSAIAIACSIGTQNISVARETPPTSAQNSPQIEEADRLNREAIQQFERGQYNEAIDLAKRSLELLKKALGEEHPDIATRLNTLAFFYRARGQYSEAEPLFQQALEMRRRLFPEEHPDIARSLNDLAELYTAQGRYPEAEPLFQQALEMRRKLLPEEHPDIATTLNYLAGLYYKRGRYADAEPLYEEAIAIFKQTLGEAHPNVASSLNNLALLYDAQSRYAEAEILFQEVLEIYRKAIGEEHPFVATTLISLGELYYSQGRYAKSESHIRQGLELFQRLLGEEHPLIATSLNNLARLYQSQGRYAEAETLHRQALAMFKNLVGEEHPLVATSLNNLADLYQSTGDYAEAETLFKQALEMLKRSIAGDHPNIATTLNSLARLYYFQGRYDEAETLFQEALEMRRRLLGDEHPDVAGSLNNLAHLYNTQSRFEEAEPLYREALEMLKRLVGEEHPNVATGIASLGRLYESQGKYAEAEPLYREALEMRRNLLGEEHPNIANNLNSLAAIYTYLGKDEEAERFYRQSAAMTKRLFGNEHPNVASVLNNWAEFYRSQGRYDEAEPLYREALEMRQKLLGEEHPLVALNLNTLALLYQSRGDTTRALELLRRGLEVQEQNINVLLATGSDRQKRDSMEVIAGTTYNVISFHLREAPDNPEVARLALTTILRRKGRVLDAVADSLQLLRQNATPETRPLLEEWQNTLSQLANRRLNPPEVLTETYRQEVANLKQKADRLEGEISKLSAEFRAEIEPATIASVQKLIPDDAALIELVLYRPFDVNARTGRFGKPHYVAYILKSSGEPEWVDLGEAEPIHQAIDRGFFPAISNGETSVEDVKTAARNVDKLLMEPIRQKLGDVRHLIVSPDSQLNRIPLAALVDENNKYLVENYTITYLTTGRDLLKLQRQPPSIQPPVLVAYPDYASPVDLAGVDVVRNNIAQTFPTQLVSLNPDPNLGTRESRDLWATASLLPGTEEEAKLIAPLLGDAIILMENQATENAIKQVRSPEILHIATHGFFLQDLERVSTATSNPFSRGGLTVEFDENVPFVPDDGASPKPENLENPLLRSGLIFAGFNNRSSGEDDGALTALEVSNLRLSGTKLVVLSACDTGRGDVENGEGVYGLRRAFTIAGAQTQAISLWSVDDASTRDLMVNYYRRLLENNEGRSEAMRRAQLDLLNVPASSHPYYWAAFILSGDWKPMN